MDGRPSPLKHALWRLWHLYEFFMPLFRYPSTLSLSRSVQGDNIYTIFIPLRRILRFS
jgi:hypothetical protein